MRRIDRTGQITDSPGCKIQDVATTFLCDTTQKRDFASPITTRASKILGPISGHLMAQIIPMIRNAAQASRPGLAVGILRVLCNGMYTAKRFLADTEEPTCREGCLDEPDCLSHYNRCPLHSNTFVAIWRNAGVTFEGTVYSTTSSLKLYSEAFNMG